MARTPARSSGRSPAAAPLTREVVLRAALEIIDAGGADGLTMRRLGQALDCDPMALYRFAANKNDLLDGVVELVVGPARLDPTASDWAEQLRSYARSFRAIAVAHPKVVPLIVTHPLATPLALRPLGTLRPLEETLELLMRAGFSATQALDAYRSLQGLLYGHILNELQELVDNPNETDDVLRLGLQRLPLAEFPRIRGLAATLTRYDGSAELERSLDILLDGLGRTATTVDGPHDDR